MHFGAGLSLKVREISWTCHLLPSLSLHEVRVKHIPLLPEANSDIQQQLWGCTPAKYLRDKRPALGGLLLWGQQVPTCQSTQTQNVKSMVNSVVFPEPSTY